ncbi:hypothetical protein BH10ACT1_BH10ACT1_35560 [soil metagenome]
MSRARRPAVLVWLLAVPFALLVGVAIAGSPFVDRDVPLRDRGVSAVDLSPSGTAPQTTSTTVAGD